MESGYIAVLLVFVTGVITISGSLLKDWAQAGRERKAATLAARRRAILEFEDAILRYRGRTYDGESDQLERNRRDLLQQKVLALRLELPELDPKIESWLSALPFGHPDKTDKYLVTAKADEFFARRDEFEAEARKYLS